MQKILIVDDSKFMRSILKNILKEGGYSDIFEAEDGTTALKLWKSKMPDLILLDIIMPLMDGIEVLKRLPKSKVKVIMVTAVGEERMVKKAMDLGAADFVVKPFNTKQVIETLRKALSGR